MWTDKEILKSLEKSSKKGSGKILLGAISFLMCAVACGTVGYYMRKMEEKESARLLSKERWTKSRFHKKIKLAEDTFRMPEFAAYKRLLVDNIKGQLEITDDVLAAVLLAQRRTLGEAQAQENSILAQLRLQMDLEQEQIGYPSAESDKTFRLFFMKNPQVYSKDACYRSPNDPLGPVSLKMNRLFSPVAKAKRVNADFWVVCEPFMENRETFAVFLDLYAQASNIDFVEENVSSSAEIKMAQQSYRALIAKKEKESQSKESETVANPQCARVMRHDRAVFFTVNTPMRQARTR